jgi:hypothetical protein
MRQVNEEGKKNQIRTLESPMCKAQRCVVGFFVSFIFVLFASGLNHTLLEMSSHHPAYTMAGLVTAGGLIGYARTKSVPSLFAGLAFGSMFAFSGSVR